MKSGGRKNRVAISATAPALTGPTYNLEPNQGPRRSQPQPQPQRAPLPPTQRRDPERYEILNEHGRGGLGRVSRAHDRELGRDVAIKELLSRGDAHEVRFLREVLITARLEHPGIVPVHEAGRWPDGTPFYAMKLVSGRSLRDLMSERPIEQRIGLLHHVIAVADALAYAHGRNIIHRDLKPANVVVGDFGETIVIDWGLAKDLTSSDPPDPVGSGPVQTPTSDELTCVGTVLGTPAYMAPEQERGEHVDQRADVFAIGTMLWELCADDKVPAEAELRHRILRDAGIDDDLATIIDKALEPDPARRYPHAGALAADLKAFKAGERIAARRYSLYAVLAHWTRRHRTLALSAAAVVAILVIGSVLFVRNIAVERDRADGSEEVARRAQASAESSLDELTLKHAQLLLTTDPSAAIDALASYHGADRGGADQIRAEARGRGVAFVRALPHADNVLAVVGAPGGTILSLSTDGTIARTLLDGTSAVLGRDVSRSGVAQFSPSRHLLAYACDPADVCLFDVPRAARIPISDVLRGVRVAGMSFAPDGNLLALMSTDAVLTVVDLTDPARPTRRLTRPIAGGQDVEFLDSQTVVVVTVTGVELLRLTGATEPFAFPDLWCLTTGATEHELALANTDGHAVVLGSFPARVAVRNELCHGPIVGLRFLAGRRSVAYACREGAVGIWDLQRNTVTLRAQLEGHADLIATSPAGDYIVAAGGNGTVTVIDLATDLVASYKGHGARLTAITPPTPAHPFVISADVRGAVRAWPLPSRIVRVAATASSQFNSAIFDEQSASLIATTWHPALTTFAPATGARAVRPHEPSNTFLEQAGRGGIFATYGITDLVELWSSATMTRTSTLHTGHGVISQLRFVGDDGDLITAGSDGRVMRWTSAGKPTLVLQHDRPIDAFAVSASGTVVFSTGDGALWRTVDDGRPIALRPPGGRVNRMLARRDAPVVYVGYASGEVVAIDTTTWRQELVLRGSGAVRQIAITRDGGILAVATNDGTIHVGTRQGGAITWSAWPGHARDLTLASDGLLVVACTDGTLWLYAPARQRWLCLPTGTVDLGKTVVAASGKAAAALDQQGRLLWIDLDAARNLLD